MTEVVRKGIQEAQVQLQKANEERLLEEVGSCWGSPGWCPGEEAQQVVLSKGSMGGPEQGLYFAGSVAANPCSRIRAELVFSSPGFTKGKKF